MSTDLHQNGARRRQAAKAAEQWLATQEAVTPSAKIQRELGMGWCAWIGGADEGKVVPLLILRGIPTIGPLELMHCERDDLLRFANSLAAGEGFERDGSRTTTPDPLWEPVLGSLAVSSARRGDLHLCAALLRTAASMGLYAKKLIWAEAFLLDQQSECGAFGRLANEAAMIGAGSGVAGNLMLTVTVLWSLAAVEQVVRFAGARDPHR